MIVKAFCCGNVFFSSDGDTIIDEMLISLQSSSREQYVWKGDDFAMSYNV